MKKEFNYHNIANHLYPNTEFKKKKRIQNSAKILAFDCMLMHVELGKHIDGTHIDVDFALFS